MTTTAETSIVVGTAGHIDHGKSALVKALTGVDPDRLPEEKARGMTIDLGFADLALPSVLVSFVDVPGHERFVTTMVAGVTGVDAALLVVAADEGVMPQTREHVQILDLLGVRSGVIALTKADLADGAMIDEATGAIRQVVEGSGLHGWPIVPCSARSGQGIDALKERLGALASGTPQLTLDRLVIDRVFTVSGFGTVVTGSSAGAFAVGDDVEIQPEGRKARIRGIQRHGTSLAVSPAGRTALNLAGVERTAIRRGDVVIRPGALSATIRVDAHIRLLSTSAALTRDQQVMVSAGTAAVPARVFPLEGEALGPGASGWAQLRLSRPACVWRGQRVILRELSPARTIAGAMIADVAPPRRARDHSVERLHGLLNGEIDTQILAALGRRPLNRVRLARLLAVRPEILDVPLRRLCEARLVLVLGSKLFTGGAIAALWAGAERSLRQADGATPESRGVRRERLRQALHLSPVEMAALVDAMGSGNKITLPAPSSPLAPAAEALVSSALPAGGEESDRIVVLLNGAGFQPPPIEEVMTAAHAGHEAVLSLESGGQLVRIEQSMYLTRPTFLDLIGRVIALLDGQGGFTIATLRDELATSRKYALAFAGYLDANRLTRRVGDARKAGKNLETYRERIAHSG